MLSASGCPWSARSRPTAIVPIVRRLIGFPHPEPDEGSAPWCRPSLPSLDSPHNDHSPLELVLTATIGAGPCGRASIRLLEFGIVAFAFLVPRYQSDSPRHCGIHCPFAHNPNEPGDGNRPVVLDAITAVQGPPPSPWPIRG